MSNPILQLVSLFCLFLGIAESATIFRSVHGNAGTQKALLIYAPGSGLPTKNYEDAIRKIQESAARSQISLSVAMPDSTVPVASLFEKSVRQTLERGLAEIGESSVPVFCGGHSLGGISMQNLVFDFWKNKNQKKATDPLMRHPCQGLFLFASAVQRKYRPDNGGSFPDIPILTMGGDLDGLFRVFRLAESYYHAAAHSLQQVVHVLQGANHMSFLDGKPSAFVFLNDLRSEVSSQEVHSEVGEVVANFLAHHMLTTENNSSAMYLKSQQKRSADYFEPILDALKLEGSYHLKPPCNGLPKGETRDCWRGSDWTAHAQKLMGKLEDVQYEVQDAFWKVWLVNPVHLPEIHSPTCDKPDNSCKLNITTVSQCTYQVLDGIDSGFTPSGCEELRAKLKSRQSVHIAAGIKNANFTELDDHNHVCQNINQHAWSWALEKAPKAIIDRFYKHGIRLEMFEDKGPYGGGPGWIWTKLEFKKRRNMWLSTDYVTVRSPTMRTPNNFKIKLSAGFHYCKLLSPARALEWIYHDGLRDRYSLRKGGKSLVFQASN